MISTLILRCICKTRTYLLPVHSRAAEHDVHRPAAVLLTVLTAAMIQASEHYKGLTGVQASVHDTLGPIRTEVGLLIPPQMAAGNHSGCAILTVGVATRHEEAHEHVTVGMIRIDGRVAGMMVLIIAMEPLGRSAGLDVHGDGNGEERVRDVDRRLVPVPAASLQAEEVFYQILFARRRWPMTNGEIRNPTARESSSKTAANEKAQLPGTRGRRRTAPAPSCSCRSGGCRS